MAPFQYHRATSLQDAVTVTSAQPTAAIIAGGSDLLQLWKAGLTQPALIVDITHLPLTHIELRGNELALGALVTLSAALDHPLLLERCPAIAQALLASASPQLRNLATLGGNLLQRTRCNYFRHRALPCNKREPGSGCGALQGEHRNHAIFGTSPQCIATHASDLAVALVAANARLHLYGPAGERTLAASELWRQPGAQPQRDHALAAGELITEIIVPDAPATRRSHYLKVTDRAAFEFAVVTVAAGLAVENNIVRAAQIAAGGVGTVPWRLPTCEALLIDQRVTDSMLARAAEAATTHAAPLAHNGFKIPLLQRALLRALQTVLAHEAP
jgi:xanthine dehydrogenase YagS FAD-binding subunit